MTDERQGEALWRALGRLPRGSGIIIRHYALPPPERRPLARRICRLARKRGLVAVFAGPERSARLVGAVGSHGRSSYPGSRKFLRTMSVHDHKELVAAKRARADLIFVSPVFPTRSHPGARTLGRIGLGRIARETDIPIIALGGMTAKRARALRCLGIYGWAAISALTPEN